MSLESKILSIEDIKRADDVLIEEIEVPEWGGKLKLKGITEQEFHEIIKASQNFNETTKQMEVDNMKFEISKLVYGIVEPEMSVADIVWLKNKSSIVIKALLFQIDLLSSGIKPSVYVNNTETNKDKNEK